jgi:ACR3 family arsenite transporter
MEPQPPSPSSPKQGPNPVPRTGSNQPAHFGLGDGAPTSNDGNGVNRASSASTSPAAGLPILARLSLLDRFLPLWILLAMALGLLLGRWFPSIPAHLDGFKVGQTSLPIALGLMLMMYPVLAKVRYGEVAHGLRHRRFLGLALLLVWGLGPLLMFGLAWIFLPNQPEFRSGLIMIGIAPCIAMVLIWINLAQGDGEAAALLVAINSIIQVLAYALLSHFYLTLLPSWLGLESQSIQVSTTAIAKAVAIFLGLPLLAGYGTRRLGVGIKGLRWYEQTFLPRISPLALYGLLFTIVVMFALQGQAITNDPLTVASLALPLLLYFLIMWGVAFGLGTRFGFGYGRSTTLAFTAAGNNFELAIAVSISVWGVTSKQALAGVIGPLIEVPALVSLVYLALAFRRRLIR